MVDCVGEGVKDATWIVGWEGRGQRAVLLLKCCTAML